jgi:hypothetical protein
MKTVGIVALGLLALLGVAGCNKSEAPPPIDQSAAKAQPGADTPPAAANKPTAAQIKQMKTGD